MKKKVLLFCLTAVLGCLSSMGRTVYTTSGSDWQPVSSAQAVAFVEEFYTHMPAEGNVWNEAILQQYLAPAALQVLQKEADDVDDQKYASWWLTCTDCTGQVARSSQQHAAEATTDGRVSKTFGVYYWADTWLRSEQTLFYTVKSQDGRLYITQIDGMSNDAVNSVFLQLETRNEGREMENETEVEGDDPLIKSVGKIGPYAVTFYRNPADIGPGDEVGYYYYNDRPNSVFKLILVSNVAINAKGSMHVVLKEYSPKGKHTGTFDGQYECRGGGYEGTFTNSKGKKFHFELMEQY